MKKKKLAGKLSLNRKTIVLLSDEQSAAQKGGGGSVASNCYSCMSQCLCDPPPSGGTPCCPAPEDWTRMD